MTKPRAWRIPEKIRQCRPRPVTDAPARIPDSKVGQLDALLQESGVLELIDTELQGRPGPRGLPVRTVLVGLLLALHYHRSASLADVCRVLLDELRAPARSWLQHPASGPSPAVSCPRFNQVHRVPAPRPAVVDLTNKRATAAHAAAKPTVPIPQAERLRPLPKGELPRICQKPTITVRPGDLGKLDKFRQDRHYLHPTWQDAYRPERANIEGLNGRAKSHGIDISDPTRRLAHGRVAQTILLALMICSINLHIVFAWQPLPAPNPFGHRLEQTPETPRSRPINQIGRDLVNSS
ncbi:hypothetical protein [Streptomyces laurentii]|uniref:hypothetical protein n=1 Tax=Streptomyces laurentii TaxID=39478 RepID=UPI0036AFC022